MTSVRNVTRGIVPGADVMVPSYSSSVLSNEQPIDLVREYLSAIDRAAAAVSYDKITFVGRLSGSFFFNVSRVSSDELTLTPPGTRASAVSTTARN